MQKHLKAILVFLIIMLLIICGVSVTIHSFLAYFPGVHNEIIHP
jgi:hypothetical protein